MKIKGLEDMSLQQLQMDVNAGGRFVIFTYCISILVMTFRRPSDIYYIPAGQSTLAKGLPFSALSLILGWWGFPWGLIYTPAALFTNFSGGKDVTPEVMEHLRAGVADFSDLEKANS